MASRVEMIIETLKANPEKKFTARDLAKEFVLRYPKEIAEKQENPRYKTEEKLIAQLTAEIGGKRTERAKAICPNVATRDKPRPRVYYWEQDLYPMLIEYLSKNLGLYCQRIDERKSKNSHSNGGNHWLRPAVVALEPLDQGGDEVVRSCVRSGNHNSVRLWSFEVKKHLTKDNVRKYFFQAVSNSSWANFGYLVATGLNSDVEGELQMLSSLHGIGVLILDTESLFDSQILIPAQERVNVDWQSANRIVSENSDFHHYIEQVGIYNQTGRLIKSAWNK
ncbi:HrgA protein [Vibrio sp. Vb2133]|uniref:COG2958 family protein n=1 Tax=Vibrio TaxID=662 RepID=UPI0028D9CD81|nr:MULTISPECIES: HrgA protein [unclassified Vibrio]ELJ8795501.1 HrgA protein [Vibrio parahaemolyticus]MDW1748966.1 HrgA protein [Vibrio sp. Vb2133]MDW1790965.1 HrgA protein [Vibrio sp. Vb2132]MDW3148661.1 HrgA protein [Vibrio sp. 2132-1]HCE1951722.1 HrgA protein [Vibrio parahaemolyticus]